MGEINIDKDNAVELTSLGIQLEAVEDKIIVVMDQFKSGYECKECGGTGKIKSTVVEGADKDCPTCEGRGALLVVPQISQSLPTLGTVVSVGEKTRWAKFQSGEWVVDLSYEILNSDLLFKAAQESEGKKIKIRPGAKVLFQPHVGTLIPFKGNLRLKIMREHEPLCVIYGTDIDSRDFIDFDIPLNERF